LPARLREINLFFVFLCALRVFVVSFAFSLWLFLPLDRNFLPPRDIASCKASYDRAGAATLNPDSSVTKASVELASDEQLMLDFQQDSREAFAELFERYRDIVYGFFRRRLDQSERAEELAQETFLAVLKGVQRYEPRSAFRAYLFGIAFKLLAAERRKNPPAPNGTREAPDPPATDRVDDGLWVRQALAKLDERDREVLLLREYEQLSYAEIARLLRLPVNTVRSRLFRARMALKDALMPEPGSSRGAA
jgi:RNA polymerase sigma-70 factor, ECF subfamily